MTPSSLIVETVIRPVGETTWPTFGMVPMTRKIWSSAPTLAGDGIATRTRSNDRIVGARSPSVANPSMEPELSGTLASGMSQGAALAFLITGAGTSLGALGGALTIARWRVIAIVIGTLWLGSTVLGFLYNLLVM